MSESRKATKSRSMADFEKALDELVGRGFVLTTIQSDAMKELINLYAAARDAEYAWGKIALECGTERAKLIEKVAALVEACEYAIDDCQVMASKARSLPRGELPNLFMECSAAAVVALKSALDLVQTSKTK